MSGTIDHDRAAGLVARVASQAAGKIKSFHDGQGLYFTVDARPVLKGGKPSASWVFRYSLNRKARMHGLGPWPTVTPAKARSKAALLRVKIKADRIDPVAERQAAREAERLAEENRKLAKARARTFKQAADAYIASHKTKWSNSKHAAQWTSTLSKWAYPLIGELPVAEVDTALVVRVLEQPVGDSTFWNELNETAGRVRNRIELVLDYAKGREWRTGENPARLKGHLGHILPKQSKTKRVKPRPALPYRRMYEFMTALKKDRGQGSKALQFAILTAARSQEVRLATWSEIDLARGLWTVSADHMKMKAVHTVPLSPPALALLESLPQGEPGDLVFPSATGKPLSDMTLSAVIRRMNEGEGGPTWVDPFQGNAEVVPHGFRSTFSTWANGETHFEPQLVEVALAHKLPSAVAATYNRSDAVKKRAALMEEWAKVCAHPWVEDGGNIVRPRQFKGDAA